MKVEEVGNLLVKVNDALSSVEGREGDLVDDGAALLSAIDDRLVVGSVEALQASYIYRLYVPVLA